MNIKEDIAKTKACPYVAKFDKCLGSGCMSWEILWRKTLKEIKGVPVTDKRNANFETYDIWHEKTVKKYGKINRTTRPYPSQCGVNMLVDLVLFADPVGDSGECTYQATKNG